MVAGDFNLDPHGSPIWGPAHMAGWRDVRADAGPTCQVAGAAPSRIDYVLVNRPAAEMVTGFELQWDTGMRTHAALVVDLAIGPATKGWLRVPP